ncbi:N-acetylmuramoyl-L-alanine amidase family protein [Olleya aquimaris]|uniref:N-acetylmuramoyl-L-alanine amidase n=1 Tax=Olleya aquimaris TaxID=639310 RepID=A0A327RJN0_9FLAO|nr:N-acetylmuramoyl-L-alanine amidase [Olleya aquimaris]RAJ16192.1 N-acetylmuramoyl-L-alanine amidase [Olleya aquimaris]
MQTHLFKLFVSFIIVLTFSWTKTVNAQTNNDKFVVVLDAGHGGKDPGKNTKSGIKESEIALKIVLGVGKLLEKNPDIKVVYTRKTDVFIDLFKRGKIANEANADLFVSIHCNAHDTQASGSETYVLGIHRNKTNFEVAKAENEVVFLEDNYQENYKGFDPNSPESFIGLSLMQEAYLDQSIKLASLIQASFTNKLKRKNRGVKQAGFIVLHQTVMPSVLVETGFVTNKAEGAYLNSAKGQKELSKSISEAILNYKSEVDKNVGSLVIEDSIKDTISDEEKPIKNTVFKIQIAASSKALEPKAYNFKGLKDISREKSGSLYKYYFGYTSDYNKAQKLQIEAKNKGYKDAFIVAYKDGKPIKLSEALKSEVN